LLTGASCKRPKGLGCKSPHSFKGVGRCQSGIHQRSWSDPFGKVCQAVTVELEQAREHDHKKAREINALWTSGHK